MMKLKQIRWHWPISVAFVVLFGLAATRAWAEESASVYQQNLERWAKQVAELDRTDTGESADDVVLMRTWLGQAQAYLANEDFEQIDPILARVEAMAGYVEVKQRRVIAEAAARAAEEAATAAEQAAEKSRQAAEQSRKRMEHLEAKGF